MFTITFTQNGKKFDNFGDAIKSAMKNGIEEVLRNKVKPMQQEAAKNNTVIKYDMDKSKVTISGDSEEVNKKIAALLTQ